MIQTVIPLLLDTNRLVKRLIWANPSQNIKPNFNFNMAYTARVYNVMIASPGDIKEIKEIARKLILEWNILHSKKRKIVLLPIDWKYNSSPKMGERPQTVINDQVLSEADILVAIFWTRIGTPTETHISGTVEEIDRHVKKGLPALLYFSKQEVDMELIDLDQLEAVKALQKKYEAEGLFHIFKTSIDFQNDFRRHLDLTLNKEEFNTDHSDVDHASKNTKPVLSEAAKELLSTVVNSDSGQILVVETSSGLDIVAGKRNFINEQTARTKAKWRHALSELEKSNFVNSKNGNIYNVTNLGFQIYDELALEN